MKKLSILFCINYMHTGGVEKSLLSLLRALPRDRFEPHIALMQNKGELMDDIPHDVPVHVLTDIEKEMPRLVSPLLNATGILGPLHYIAAKMRGTLIPYYRHILGRHTSLKRHFDIAVAYQGPNQLLDWYVATHINAGIRLSWVHFDIAHSYINARTQRMLYPSYDRIYIVSESARESFCSVFPEFEDRTDVFHNIVDTADVRLKAEEYAVEHPDGIKMLCTVGRVTRDKGPDISIQVALELKKRGFPFCWNWVGTDELLEQCRRDVKRLGLEGRMNFVGLKPNPYPYMAAADIYVQPSRHEGYCITLAEARVFGMPMVCTDFSGTEQTAGMSNVQIVKSLNPSDIADAIVRAAGMSHEPAPAAVTSNDINKLIDLCGTKNTMI